jgi:hypothetical protein
MQSEIARFAVNQFIVECSELSLHLDSVRSCDGDMAFVSAFERARLDYYRLLHKRDALPMTDADAPLVQVTLDGLLARLRFLERRS